MAKHEEEIIVEKIRSAGKGPSTKKRRVLTDAERRKLVFPDAKDISPGTQRFLDELDKAIKEKRRRGTN